MLNVLARTHYVLERYSPHEVISGLQAGKNPLAWTLKNNERTILFSDIFSSTTFAETLPSDQFERILQVYYDIANRSVIENGGTISKLTGDSLMAYFSRGCESDALNTAIEICRRLDDARTSAKPNDPVHFL
jgi:class 3 adenylate cyclase